MVFVFTIFLFFQTLLAVNLGNGLTIGHFSCLIIVWIFFITTLKLKKHPVLCYIFYYFWVAFILGGIGMMIGHQIDIYSLDIVTNMQNMMSMTFTSTFVNWMTLVMLFTCLPFCVFSINCPLKSVSSRYKLFIHLISVLFMLFGMYIGRVISIFLNFDVFYRYYLTVFMMGSFSTGCYYLIISFCYRKLRKGVM